MNANVLSLLCLITWFALRGGVAIAAPYAVIGCDIVVGVLCLPSVFYILSVVLLSLGLDSSRFNQLICFSSGLLLTRTAAALDVVNGLVPGNPFVGGRASRQVLIGTFLHALEKPDAASKHVKRFIKNYKSGENSSENLSKCLLILAEIEMKKGNYADAKKHADDALKLVESSKQIASVKGAAMTDLCANYMKMGLIEESIAVGRRAVEAFDQNDPMQNQLHGISYNNLGLAYSYAGNYLEAHNCAKRSFNLKKAAHPVPNVSHAISHVNLSESLLFLERYAEALAEAKEAITIMDQLGFGDNLIRATALQNVGAALVDLGRFDEAKPELQAALKGKKKHMAAKDPEWYSLYLDLAKLHAGLNETNVAEKYFTDSLVVVKRQLSEDHPRYARVALEYSKFLDKNNRSAEAAELRAAAERISNKWSSKK